MSKDVGTKIKQLREDAGLTLEEVGKRIGVSRATVQRYESGVILEIPKDKIKLLAELFNVHPGYIMGWTAETIDECKIGDMVVDISDRPYITLRETTLLELFAKLNDTNKDKAFEFIEALVELQKIEASLKSEKEAFEWYKAHKKDSDGKK